MPKVFVITGPSGVGKGTLIRTLLERVPELELSVSATTRRPRPGEAHGVDYHFLADDEFERRVAGGRVRRARPLLGPALRHAALRARGAARRRPPVVLEIELQGARQIRESVPDAVQIFIAPPSEEALRNRLVGRGTDPPEQVAARLATAREELRAQDEFAHVVVNDRLEDASDALEEAVRAHLAARRRRWRRGERPAHGERADARGRCGCCAGRSPARALRWVRRRDRRRGRRAARR